MFTVEMISNLGTVIRTETAHTWSGAHICAQMNLQGLIVKAVITSNDGRMSATIEKKP